VTATGEVISCIWDPTVWKTLCELKVVSCTICRHDRQWRREGEKNRSTSTWGDTIPPTRVMWQRNTCILFPTPEAAFATLWIPTAGL